VAGLRLEPGLVELILRDVAREPGALPLLSHALRVTWEQRDGRTLTVEGYRALPGPLGFTTVRFTRDGRRIFALRDTGAAQRWEVTPDAWSRHACRVAGRELTQAEWDEFVPNQDYRQVCAG
jgi:Novel STAND NTPase 1